MQRRLAGKHAHKLWFLLKDDREVFRTAVLRELHHGALVKQLSAEEKALAKGVISAELMRLKGAEDTEAYRTTQEIAEALASGLPLE